MASNKDNEPEEHRAGASGASHPMQDDATSTPARFRKISPDPAGQTQEELIHKLRVRQAELETQGEEQVHKAALLWQNTFNSTHDGICILDREFRIVSCNRVIQEMACAKNADELVGRYCWEVMHGSTEPIPDCPLVRMLSSRKRETLELQMGDHWFVIIAEPILDEEQVLVGAVESMRDITRWKNAEAALAESEKKFRAVFDAAGEGMLVADPESRRFVMANTAIQKQLGYTEVELLSMSVTDIYPPADLPVVIGQFGKLVGGLIDNSPGLPVLRKDGTVFFADINNSFVTLQGRQYILGIFHDITERKAAEEVLQESEIRYRTLFLSSRDAIMTIEPPSWGFTTGNPSALQMFGAGDESEFCSREPWKFSPELQPDGRESGDKAREMIDIAMRTGSHFFEWTHRRLNGEDFPATVLLSRVELSGKTILLATVRDITRQKQAEEALWRNEEYLKKRQQEYRNLIHLNTEAMLVLDTDFSIVFANPAAENIFGRSSEKLSGAPFGFPVVSGELTEIEVPRPNGTVSFCEIRVSEISWEEEPSHLVILRDITNRRLMEQTIHESEKSFRGLFNTVGEAIFVMDADGKFLEVNQGALDIYGQPRDFFVNQSIEVLYAPGTFDFGQAINLLERAFSIEPQRCEITGCRSNGQTFPAECRLYRGTYFGKEVIIGLMIDITERRKAEVQIQIMNETLEQRVKDRTHDLETATDQLRISLAAKEVMLREVHHRVKNNLQIIISLLKMQSRQFSDPQTVNAIRESQNRVLAISSVHEQLFTSKDIENIDFGKYLRSLAATLYSFYNVTGERVPLRVNMENLTINIDTAIPLGLVLNELIANSLKHAFPGEKKGEISITGTQSDGMLEIRITDNGIGMRPDTGADETKSLGLKLVRMLTGQLNGTVEILPPPGTTVVLRIPQKKE